MKKKHLNVKVDGVGLNARHFAAMGKEEAVKAMEADGILSLHSKDAAWAGKAHDALVKAVADADAPPKADKKK